jgi:predicted nucleic acid-binding protein
MNEVPPATVCLDASVVVRWLLDHEMSHVASLDESDHQFVAPSLMRYEVTNALYQTTKAGGLTASTAEELLDVLVTLPIELIDEAHFHRRALSIAHHYRSGAAYDAHYVALAQHLGAELWTADKRLYNAVHPHLDFVHLVD